MKHINLLKTDLNYSKYR